MYICLIINTLGLILDGGVELLDDTLVVVAVAVVSFWTRNSLSKYAFLIFDKFKAML